MSVPPFRVLPSTMASPVAAVTARRYQRVEDATAVMGTGIVIDRHADLVAFHESIDQRLVERYVERVRETQDALAVQRPTEPVTFTPPTEPTRDQSYCDVGRHQACSGYTEDESDPETCMCTCHDDPTGGL